MLPSRRAAAKTRSRRSGASKAASPQQGSSAAAITGEAIGTIITNAAAAAGISVRFTGHSVRGGMATGARKAGHDVLPIARQGGWSPASPAIWAYIDIEDRWTYNALNNIGL